MSYNCLAYYNSPIVSYASYMPTVTIRVIESDLKDWTAAANLRGMSISEWIRRRCNIERIAAQPESAGENGSASNQDVSGIAEATVSGRSTVASGRSKHGGSVRSAKAPGEKGNVRRVGRDGKQLASDGQRGPEPLVASPNASASVPIVTRENFAEVMASIKKDELDVWARSLDSDILPKHSATSNRHTCLCSFCLTWRKANYIPYGGPGEKKKSRFAK